MKKNTPDTAHSLKKLTDHIKKCYFDEYYLQDMIWDANLHEEEWIALSKIGKQALTKHINTSIMKSGPKPFQTVVDSIITNGREIEAEIKEHKERQERLAFEKLQREELKRQQDKEKQAAIAAAQAKKDAFFASLSKEQKTMYKEMFR